MSGITSHRDLIVWQKAMDLTELVYKLSESFPKTETYRMVNQMTRSVVSIPADIAEGNARGTTKDYANFLAIAKGSAMELETYLLLAMRLKYLDEKQVTPALSLVTEISKMLTALRTKLLM